MEIKFNEVSFCYYPNTKMQKNVLNKVSFNIHSETIHGIIGNSGSGKTTLLELMNGLLIPTSGDLTVGSFSINKVEMTKNYKKLRNDVGLVFQFPEEQFFCRTVRDELLFALKNYTHKYQLEEKAIQVLKMVGLDENYLNRNPFQLSYGEKRRIAIASVLMLNPKVLLLDEPTVGLDYSGKKTLMTLIKKLREDYHKTIVIVSHDIDMIYELADSITVLSEGDVIISDTKEEIYKHIGLLKEHRIPIPRMVDFIYTVKVKKGIKLQNHRDIRDLIKDVYRNV